jgi:predicted Zn finger-like uncharacterized protein
MALITRCPVCGTLFKVVPDQLRISEGWVRCGQCAEVFDASHDLQQSDLELHTVVALDPTSADPGISSAQADPVPYSEAPPASPDVLPAAPEVLVPEPAVSEPLRDGMSGNMPELWVEPILPPADTLPVEDSVPAASWAAPASDVHYSFASASELRADGAYSLPRWMLPAIVAFLLLVLGVQGGLHNRDYLAARWPEVKPLLQAMCTQGGCSVGALRKIEAVVIESSTLGLAQNGDAYRLGITLKNQSLLDLAMPSIECIFTDVDEQTVLRRALSPAELGAATRGLFAGREWTASVDIRVTDPVSRGRIVGYRLLAFYP